MHDNLFLGQNDVKFNKVVSNYTTFLDEFVDLVTQKSPKI